MVLMITANTMVDLVLALVVGLLFGLALKKGAVSFVLALAGFVIAGYVGITFVPRVSITYEIGKAVSLLSSYAKGFQIGAIALTLAMVLFAVGIVVGIWKG